MNSTKVLPKALPETDPNESKDCVLARLSREFCENSKPMLKPIGNSLDEYRLSIDVLKLQFPSSAI